MRGQRDTSSSQPHLKWNDISKLMSHRRLGILAVQETHLTQEECQVLNETHGRRIHILASPSSNTSQAQGVAIILNRETTNTTGVTTTDIIPGRAMLIRLPWHKDLILHIVNIYAPNAPEDNASFWETLQTKWDTNHLPRPDILLGDFNITEDALDRLPCHHDNQSAITALTRFRQTLGLTDGWRTSNPTTKDYTWLRPNGTIQSRIDRIYMQSQHLPLTTNWDISDTAISTDHRLISVTLTHRSLPYIGRGRWTIPLYILENKQFQQQTIAKGITLQENIRATHGLADITDPNSPQILFSHFKSEIKQLAQHIARTHRPRIEAQIRALQHDISETKDAPSFLDDPAAHLHVAILQTKIKDLEKAKLQYSKSTSSARYWMEGETISKYWSNINSQRLPRDIIYTLTDPTTPSPKVAHRSDEMTALARDYHYGLQLQDLPTAMEPHHASINRTLSHVSRKLSPLQAATLADPLSDSSVREALKAAENGKATGLDGLPYEFWKIFQSLYDDRPDSTSPTGFNPAALLADIFNDISQRGIAPNTAFSNGWMCPLYKKGDRNLIPNYRPITVLNSDYKIFTKALTTRLLKVLPAIIHPNQAGFIPGRSIHDQIRLAELMTYYAEQMQDNGAIIALDQEKAYDKINHEYLWKALEKFNLPQSFIQTIQHLYAPATTVVIINGIISSPYTVTRGVRQGDPLSCPIFDLAIEPLACMLRNSHLHGYNIPGLSNKLITNLFADDTTAYLSVLDRFEDLTTILTSWCLASTAKFNSSKTVLIPIGSANYRQQVITSRRLNPAHPPLPPDLHIAIDTEPTRILGAWIGNRVDQAHPWTKVLDKIANALQRWGRFNPTYKGKRHIIQMIIGGMTQYLTKVQGMPKTVEHTLISLIRDFLYGPGKRLSVSYDLLCRPFESGGLKILHIPRRNEAIELTWLRSFLNLSPSRPDWAAVADVLIGDCITKHSGSITSWSKVNMFLHTWTVNTHSPSLPPSLTRMLATAKKHHVSFHAIKLSAHLKRLLPAWYHIGAKPHFRFFSQHSAAECLQLHHGVRSTGDLLHIARRRDRSDHTDSPHCPCRPCRRDRQARSCAHPHTCAEIAHLMLDRLHPKWHPAFRPPLDHLTITPSRTGRKPVPHSDSFESIFNPSVTTTGSLADVFRVFVNPAHQYPLPAHRPHPTAHDHIPPLQVWTDGSSSNNGNANACAGSGLWISPLDPRNTAARTPGPVQTNQAAEIFAIILAATSIPSYIPLIIISDSQYCIDGLTVHLPHWETRGWIGIENRTLFQAAAYHLRLRTAPTLFRWVKGHSGDQGNEAADALAAAGALLPACPTSHLLDVPDSFLLSGAKLSTLTQALAYKGIQELAPAPSRRSTDLIISSALLEINTAFNRQCSPAQLWSSIRHHDFARKITDFLWKGLHGAHKCGSYWKAFLPERQNCTHCSPPVEETLQHILLDCSAPGPSHLWSLVRALWSRKHSHWPPLSLGTILGCGLASFQSPDILTTGHDRLYRILISETAFLIWKIRCERVIDREPSRPHTIPELTQRLLSTINFRLNLDITLSRRSDKIKGAAKIPTEATWQGVLQDEERLPPDWVLKGPTPLAIWLPRPNP